jgi:hypothetical protein
MNLEQALISNGSAETIEEARQIIAKMRNALLRGEDPEELLGFYGLEPDYVFDILV